MTLPQQIHNLVYSYLDWSQAELKILDTIEWDVIQFAALGNGSPFIAPKLN